MDNKKDYIRIKYDQAVTGRKLFLKIKDTLKLSANDYIVVLADKNEKLNDTALANLEVLRKKKYADRIIIVAEKNYDMDFGKSNILWHVNTYELWSFLQYYRLLSFFSNIIVISLEKPFGTAGIIGKKGISLSDYVTDGLFI